MDAIAGGHVSGSVGGARRSASSSSGHTIPVALPVHGVVAEAVSCARPGAQRTRDLGDLLAWLEPAPGLRAPTDRTKCTRPFPAGMARSGPQVVANLKIP